MFLPEGTTRYKPINIELVNVDKLLLSLEQDRFTGFLEFDTGDTRAVILFEKGEILRSFSMHDGSPGLHHADDILKELHSGEVRGVMLPPEIVEMIARLLLCTPLHHNLSSSFTDFRTLLKSLEAEKFSGFVELETESGAYYITMEDGGPRTALHFSSGNLVRGAGALERIFNDMSQMQASISVYPLASLPLTDAFVMLSQGLLSAYTDLKGTMLTQKMWKRLSSCVKKVKGVEVGHLEFRLEELPRDPWEREKILKTLMKCELTLFKRELGEEATHSLYRRLLGEMNSPMKEIFGGIL
ncbi:MAG: hypothetical protein HXS52_08715 [Theionarchaea archaeon]|nr:hypothetical protein [Theionarchaea archaeon]MBU7038001.1 hypothetical protein [Theionarchaea archaeon]